jgi:hypothetical protein
MGTEARHRWQCGRESAGTVSRRATSRRAAANIAWKNASSGPG